MVKSKGTSRGHGAYHKVADIPIYFVMVANSNQQTKHEYKNKTITNDSADGTHRSAHYARSR